MSSGRDGSNGAMLRQAIRARAQGAGAPPRFLIVRLNLTFFIVTLNMSRPLRGRRRAASRCDASRRPAFLSEAVVIGCAFQRALLIGADVVQLFEIEAIS